MPPTIIANIYSTDSREHLPRSGLLAARPFFSTAVSLGTIRRQEITTLVGYPWGSIQRNLTQYFWTFPESEKLKKESTVASCSPRRPKPKQGCSFSIIFRGTGTPASR